MKNRLMRIVLFASLVMCMCATAFAGVGLFITIAPPPLRVYQQPGIPGEGYIWTPGYWAYGEEFQNYYWVDGTWVQPPEIGFLWTPAYWGWDGNGFNFYEGYWGREVGFYGGINYGFGYSGRGYEGGRWQNDHFYYNRSVNNINQTNIHNTYNETVINNVTVNRTSYNGGTGGVAARPTAQEQAVVQQRHIAPALV